MHCQSRKPFNTPIPSLRAKSQALPCSGSVLPAAGWQAGRAAVCREQEPAPSNKLHGKQTLSMQDRAAGAWHVGTEQARPAAGGARLHGGRAGDTISLRAPQRRRNATGSFAAKKGCAQLLSLPPPPSPLPRAPSSNLLDTTNWIIKSRLGRGKEGGKSREEPSGLCCSLPLSQAL